MTLFLKLSLTLFCTMLIGTQAVFTPANRDALKAAVDTCLSQTPDGSCPSFAATDATPGNPYGVIGAWDVSAVTTMHGSKCTFPPSLCGHAFHDYVFWIYTLTRVSSDHNSHTFCYFVFVILKRYSFLLFVVGGLCFLCCTLSCSVWTQICVQSGRVQMEYCGSDNYARK